ncbi:MAG: hypothetical protein GXC75_07725 [Xanthomonadaceae bacterium]|nr:hypothetical protein [Xanthomonadaceae bacterium]
MPKQTFLFEHPVARRYADLAGIERDLELVIEACDHFLTRPSVGSEEAIVSSRAMGAYAIVTYCRTFVEGVRTTVAKDVVNSLSGELQRAHEHFREVRHKFVAHSVNFDEDNWIEVEVEVAETGERELDSLSTNHSRWATFSPTDMSLLKRLAEEVLKAVKEESKREHVKVWEYLEGLDQGELMKVLSLESRRQGGKRSGDRRKQYGQRGKS